MHIERIDTPRCILGESAEWDAVHQALFFVDIWGQKVLRYDCATGATQSWAVPRHIGGLALREAGGALLAMQDALYTLDFASGESTKIAGPVFDHPRCTINDGCVDRRGRFVFGATDMDFQNPQPRGGVYAIDAAHQVTRLDGDIHISNSHCFSSDGRTLYCADSHLHTMYAYDYDLDTGLATNRRVFVSTQDLGGMPDGSTVDADGLVWMAVFDSRKVAAFRPDGQLERTVELPVRMVSSVAFGGPNLDILYVTSINPVAFGQADEPDAGYVYAVHGLGSRGLPESRYAG